MYKYMLYAYAIHPLTTHATAHLYLNHSRVVHPFHALYTPL